MGVGSRAGGVWRWGMGWCGWFVRVVGGGWDGGSLVWGGGRLAGWGGRSG